MIYLKEIAEFGNLHSLSFFSFPVLLLEMMINPSFSRLALGVHFLTVSRMSQAVSTKHTPTRPFTAILVISRSSTIVVLFRIIKTSLKRMVFMSVLFIELLNKDL